MPGYKVFLEDGGELSEGLTCSYCKLVLRNPVQTSESGLRLCRGCFEDANRDAAYVDELDPDDKIWPDSAVKREIASLRVNCENYSVGCDWKGLFKQLMQHSQECQYVTVECSNTGCGQLVVKAKMEAHLKEECQYRRAKCKDCGKKMCFIELQDHLVMCPNAPRKCKYCDITVPEHKFGDHIIKCECIGSQSTKMLEVYKEMAKVCQQATKKIDALENYRQEDAQRIQMLENCCQEDAQRIKMLESCRQEDAQRIKMLENCHQEDIRKIETLERKDELLEMQAIQNESKIQALEDETISNEHLCNKSLDLANQTYHKVIKVERDMWEFRDGFQEIKKRAERDHLQVAAYLQDLNLAAATASGSNVMPREKSLEAMKHLEEKVLEVERVNNILNVHLLELELQLQASLASTHNGAFLWHIPEVRQRIRDAKIGRITSIYSPPFYTGRNGYKMCIRAYLNGDGSGEGTHLSIFLVLMKSEYDTLLQWPFESKVSLILVDQDHMKHLVQTFKPNPQSCSFQKPKTDMNVASGCPEFADLSILDNTSYVKDDQMYIKAVVDTSSIRHP